jgi:hypothetical protein
MSAQDIVERYSLAWAKNDLATARAQLADDLDFQGSLETHRSADSFLDGLRKFREGPFERMVPQSQVAGPDAVFLLYDCLLKNGQSLRCAEYFRVENQKIRQIRLVFDTAPLAALMSPPRTVHQGRFYDFLFCTKTRSLVFGWKPTSEALTDDDFKEGLANLAGYAFELRPRHIVIDLREFRGRPSADAAVRWRAEVAVPRYNQSGVRRFAYLKSPGQPGPEVGPPKRSPGEDFETCIFDSEERMLEWFQS